MIKNAGIMNSDQGVRSAFDQPLALDATERELRWRLQQIFHWIDVGEGGFRAVTGKWSIQLTKDELMAWVEWFIADPANMPAMPVRVPAEVPQRVSQGFTTNAQSPRRGLPAAGPAGLPALPSFKSLDREAVRQPPVEPIARTPMKITQEEHAFLDELRRGTGVQQAARLVGVPMHRLYLRRRQNPALDEAWRAALAARP